ncbi:MAG: hypothetical protein N3E49_03500 [Bacteroidia bacterium]|nr:hypothetical protein [Bacteroidia bacterium]
MKKSRFWGQVCFVLAGVSASALFCPQFRIHIWDDGRSANLYLWGGHVALQATVSVAVYVIAAVWGLAGVGGLFLAGKKLYQHNRAAIAWMNWAAFFVAMELVFLLVAAEEVLTDLRVRLLHADSYASVGSWISFCILLILLFLPSRVKKQVFQNKDS